MCIIAPVVAPAAFEVLCLLSCVAGVVGSLPKAKQLTDNGMDDWSTEMRCI